LHASITDIEDAALPICNAGIWLRLERNDLLDIESFRIDNLDVCVSCIRYKQLLAFVS